MEVTLYNVGDLDYDQQVSRKGVFYWDPCFQLMMEGFPESWSNPRWLNKWGIHFFARARQIKQVKEGLFTIGELHAILKRSVPCKILLEVIEPKIYAVSFPWMEVLPTRKSGLSPLRVMYRDVLKKPDFLKDYHGPDICQHWRGRHLDLNQLIKEYHSEHPRGQTFEDAFESMKDKNSLMYRKPNTQGQARNIYYWDNVVFKQSRKSMDFQQLTEVENYFRTVNPLLNPLEYSFKWGDHFITVWPKAVADDDMWGYFDEEEGGADIAKDRIVDYIGSYSGLSAGMSQRVEYIIMEPDKFSLKAWATSWGTIEGIPIIIDYGESFFM
jgi:hypothetical protein